MDASWDFFRPGPDRSQIWPTFRRTRGGLKAKYVMTLFKFSFYFFGKERSERRNSKVLKLVSIIKVWRYIFRVIKTMFRFICRRIIILLFVSRRDLGVSIVIQLFLCAFY